MMFFLTNFKNRIAVFLTLLYIFSFIPKTKLHNLVANHTDVVCNVTHSDKFNQPILSANKGFHCFLEDGFIKSPAFFNAFIKKTIPLFFNNIQNLFSSNFYTSLIIFKKQNRGPPLLLQ